MRGLAASGAISLAAGSHWHPNRRTSTFFFVSVIVTLVCRITVIIMCTDECIVCVRRVCRNTVIILCTGEYMLCFLLCVMDCVMIVCRNTVITLCTG